MIQGLATQSVVLSGAELASHGSLLEMQNFRPYSRPWNQKLHLNKVPVMPGRTAATELQSMDDPDYFTELDSNPCVAGGQSFSLLESILSSVNTDPSTSHDCCETLK